MNMQDITEKLKDILATDGKKNIKDVDVAHALSIKPNHYAQLKFRNKIPFKEILNFLHARQISINLFFYGTDPKKIQESSRRYRILRLYDSVASLGGGALNEHVRHKEVVVDNEIMDYFRSNNCDMIRATGDSMESAVQDGDVCLIDRTKCFKEGKIYAINTPDGLLIKEIRTRAGEIIAISRNSVYPPVFYRSTEVQIIGEVVGVMRRI